MKQLLRNLLTVSALVVLVFSSVRAEEDEDTDANTSRFSKRGFSFDYPSEGWTLDELSGTIRRQRIR